MTYEMSSGPGRSVSLVLGEVVAEAPHASDRRERRDGYDGGGPSEGHAHSAPYRGELSTTRRRSVRMRSGDALIAVEVYVAVNADADPELGARARGENARSLHALTVAGEAIELALPLIYHEPSRRLFALMLPPVLRHREIEERIELYRQLAAEQPGTPIPSYVLQFAVVVGAEELRALRERAAAPASNPPPAPPAPPALHPPGPPSPISASSAPTSETLADAATHAPPSAIRAPAFEGTPRAISQTATVRASAARTAQRRTTDTAIPADTIDEELSAGLTPAVVALPPGADPITTEARELATGAPDPWLQAAIAGGEALGLDQGRARLALRDSAISDASILRRQLDLRVVLQRAISGPLISLLVGDPLALRSGQRRRMVACHLDVTAERERALLAQLARRFEVVVDVVVAGRWTRRVILTAPLADNIGYLVRAADDTVQRLGELGLSPSAAHARTELSAPDYDLTGAQHRNAEWFRDDQLVQIGTAEQLRAALAMTLRFTLPEGEDYLVCVRGFPLSRWRRLRRHVLERAVTWGIWMGSELAHVAISEGLARSRRDLLHRLADGFELLKRHPIAFDLDPAAIEGNAAALSAEAEALGVIPGKPRTLIDSEMDSVVAGTIDLVPSGPIIPIAEQTEQELISSLTIQADRLAAAMELCDRRAAAAAPELVRALSLMNRGDAARGFAACVRLGDRVEDPLIGALSLSKSYVRQGAALALAMLRGDRGVAAIVNLLLTEPTDIWREVARAIGQVGPQGLHHLEASVREVGLSARAEERIAWAMAYLGARDCRRAVAQISSSHGIMAPIAAKALALVEPAQREQLGGSGEARSSEVSSDASSEASIEASIDASINRAFSRQFFVAVEGDHHDDSAVPVAAADHGSRPLWSRRPGERGQPTGRRSRDTREDATSVAVDAEAPLAPRYRRDDDDAGDAAEDVDDFDALEELDLDDT
jgi:hypothetical protein